MVQIDLNEGVERLNYSMKIQGMQDSAISYLVCHLIFNHQIIVKRLNVRTWECSNSTLLEISLITDNFIVDIE